MSVYQLKTFSDLVTAIREELGIQSTDNTAISRIKRDLNITYQAVAAKKDWWWLHGETTLQMQAYYSTGTVSVSQGSASVTLSSAPVPSYAGYKFTVDGFNEIYNIESHSAGATTLKLSELYAGSTTSAATFKIWKDYLPLPIDCKETLELRHEFYPYPLEAKGIQEFRQITTLAPKCEGKPKFYCTGEFVDPAPTSSIASIPATLTRASAGVRKTIVFASNIPTTIATKISNGDPVRWRISGAGHPSYNGDYIITSVSTTTTANDTITYTGRAELTEDAASDTSISVSNVDMEQAFDRYRKLYLYPSLYNARVTLQVDYLREIIPLENDSDEPLVPVEKRTVLLYGALQRTWSRMRNPDEAARNYQLYQQDLTEMASDMQDTQDKPILKPSNLYLTAKRSASRRNKIDAIGTFGGIGGAGSAVTGPASSIAYFDSTGQIQGLSAVSPTELGYVDGVTSSIQTQLDGKQSTTLSSGKIMVGNASNVATALNVSGDATLDNTGLLTIGAGAVTNTKVASNAAIAYSKLSLTGSIVDADIASGAAIAYSKLNLAGSVVNADVASGAAIAYSKLNLAGSVVNADIASGAAIAYSKLNLVGSVVNADISASAAIARSKIATGTTGQVVYNDASTGALTSEAQLAISRGGTGQGTASAAFNALAPTTTKGDLIAYSTTNTRVAIGTDGFVLTADSASTPGLKWAAIPNAPTFPGELYNLGLSVVADSPSTGNLKVALKQADGSTDPSTGSSAVKVAMRSSTATSGAYNERSITGALSQTLSVGPSGTASGTTLGMLAGQDNYLWLYLIDSDGAGTMKLGMSTIKADETLLQSTVPETSTISSISTNTITTSAAHGLSVYDPVTIFNTTNNANVPTGITVAKIYYVLTTPSSTTLTLSTSRGGSTASISGGTGTNKIAYAGTKIVTDAAYTSMPVRLIGAAVVHLTTTGIWTTPTKVITAGAAQLPVETIALEYHAGTTAINNAWTSEPEPTRDYDTHNLYSPDTTGLYQNAGYFVAPTAGKWEFRFQMEWDTVTCTTSGKGLYIQYELNGSVSGTPEAIQIFDSSGTTQFLISRTASKVINLSAGDAVRWGASKDSAISGSTPGGGTNNRIEIRKVG